MGRQEPQRRQDPKITFTPHGASQRIKAEIMISADLYDEARDEENAQIRQKMGITKPREPLTCKLANLFDRYWIKYWIPKIRASRQLEDVQTRFTKSGETVAEPLKTLMADLAPAYEAPEKPDKPAAGGSKRREDLLGRIRGG